MNPPEMSSDPVKLILASQSPRRRELLAQGGWEFAVETAEVEELTSAEILEDLPLLNAALKANAVAVKHPGSWVLGADTMIIFEGRAVGKPRDPADAAAMLRAFSGKSHEVVTGIALVCREQHKEILWRQSSTVRFKVLTGEDIDFYLKNVNVLDKAGAYAIQEHGELIIESFTGELENIIGLPMKKLTRKLEEILQ